MKLSKALFALLVFVLPLSALLAAPAGFCLARAGKAQCVIVTAARPTPSARLAALEIQSQILRISGADVPIRTEQDATARPRILVGPSSATAELGFKPDTLAPQEYIVAFRPDTIVLLGRDWADTEANRQAQGYAITGEPLSATRHRVDYWAAVGYPERSQGAIELPGLFDEQGTCLAAYEFLERFCGVRYYGPSVLTTVVPTQASIIIEGTDIRRSPALKHRAALPGGNWPFLRNQWGQFTPEQLRLYWRRIRQGGERWAGNHTFYPATIKAAFTNAAYQSHNPGSRGSQLCYSSPVLVHQVAQMARDFFDGKGSLPQGWKAMGDYFTLVPDDNLNLCNCANCAALLGKSAPGRNPFFSNGAISEYWFSFVNAVAREVRVTHPSKYIATLAYWAYAFPPSFPLEPNVSVAPCLHTCYYPSHAAMKENDLKFYGDWLRQTSAPMFLWVYYHHPMEPALIENWKCFPNVMVHQTADWMRTFIRDGVRGIFECGEQDQLEQYIMAKIWLDPALDVDATMDEFFRLYFGPAGGPMKQYYLRLEQIATDPGNYPEGPRRPQGQDWKRLAWQNLGTPERLKELDAFMNQAQALAVSDPEKARLTLWRTAFHEWMQAGAAAAK